MKKNKNPMLNSALRAICYAILSVIFLSCNPSEKSSPKVLIESPTNLIVSASDKSPYTGIISLTEKDNIKFRGEVLNGKRHGTCYWVKKNGDTLQIQKYDKGEMMYSKQLDEQGNITKEWIKYKPEITAKDSAFVANVLNVIETSKFEVLENKVQKGLVDYIQIIQTKISKLEQEFGTLETITLEKIDKSFYNFKSGNHLELKTIVKFQSKSLNIGMRLLEDQEKLTAIELWEIRPKPEAPKSYKELNLWSYLNL